MGLVPAEKRGHGGGGKRVRPKERLARSRGDGKTIKPWWGGRRTLSTGKKGQEKEKTMTKKRNGSCRANCSVLGQKEGKKNVPAWDKREGQRHGARGTNGALTIVTGENEGASDVNGGAVDLGKLRGQRRGWLKAHRRESQRSKSCAPKFSHGELMKYPAGKN